MSVLHITYTSSDSDLIPAGVTIPANVRKAMTARDAAFDDYAEALIKYDDVIGQGYIERAQQRDADRAREAVRRGQDPHDGISEVARVTAEHGRAVGIINALAERVRQHDTEVYRQWARALPSVEAELRDALPKDAQEMRQAEAAYRAAKGAYRARVATLAYVSLQQKGRVRSLTDAPRYWVAPKFDQTEEELARLWLAEHSVDIDDAA
ncbi:hypothetical protein GCM10009535_40270 [Streptomyces thermocarboxydovorans]|uniref:Uncharacterized protein n=1 Tax=Streptomyces thermocarboxydovorans TaxID=59298 RepID=A0ABP3SS18_9ACTN